MEKSRRRLFSNPDILTSKSYQITLEVFNAITHGIGFLLAVIATGFLVHKGVQSGQWTDLIAYTVYGLSMCVLYFNSMMYHSLSFTSVAPIFKFYDHASIYLLIAGTYTPFCLIVVGGWLGWALFAIEWGLALVGIFGKARQTPFIIKYSTGLYLLMGWMAVIAIKPLIENFNLPGALWLLGGGIIYSIGTYFYSRDHIYAYFHVIWHYFVLLASIFMFVSIYFFV